MIISLQCPVCGEASSVSDMEAGLRFTCKCGRELDSSSAVVLPVGPASHAPRPTPSPPRSFRGEVSERIGKYRIVGKLGSGGFATVYLAHDEKLDRKVALKVANPGVFQDQGLHERFLKEARATARMKHEGIAQVYEVDEDGEYCYIASEFLEGRTLRQLIDEDKPDIRRAVQIVVDIAGALAHAHAAGVVHRDVKPSNVVVTDKDEVKLIDFGLARLDTSTQTKEHAFLGTYVYMSPEQARGITREVGNPSDQYNLGVVLYELLCGQTPFRGDSRLVLHQIINVPVLRPRELNPEVPAELEAICLKMLAKTPAGRYESCRIVASVLKNWLGGLPIDQVESPSIAAVEPPSSIAEEPSAISELVSSSALRLSPVAWPASTDQLRDREPLRNLTRLAVERADSEESTERSRKARIATAEREVEQRRRDTKRQFDAERLKQLRSASDWRKVAEGKFEMALAVARNVYEERCERVNRQVEDYIREAEEKLRWTHHEANAVLEARVHRIEALFELDQGRTQDAFDIYHDLDGRLNALAIRSPELGLSSPSELPLKPKRGESFPKILMHLAGIGKRASALESQPTIRLLRGFPELCLLATTIVLAYPAALLFGPWLGVLAAFFVGVLARDFFRRRVLEKAARVVRIEHGALCHDLRHAHGLIHVYRGRQKRRMDKRMLLLQTRFNETIDASKERRDYRIRAVEHWRILKLERALAEFDLERASIEATLAQGDGSDRRLKVLEHNQAKTLETIDREHRQRLQEIEVNHLVEWGRLAEDWRNGVSDAAATINSIRETVDRQNPQWEHPSWNSWTPPIGVPSVVRFGDVTIGLDRVPKGTPRDGRLMEGLPDSFVWPALLAFPEHANLLVEVPEEGLESAVEFLKSIGLRMLTSVPAGLLKLTIIDPTGFGFDFGSFLHLSDFPDLLAPVRTESGQIEQTLDDLCGHMKKIIQGYLRDEHQTICEFNSNAGEVAEPFRILIISDFPSGFSEVACSRLAQITSQGNRCGVVTLLAANTSRSIPPGFSLRDFAAHSAHLTWRGGKLAWNDPDFGPYSLAVDPAPPLSLTRRVVRQVGEAAVRARKVEVPFAYVEPHVDRWWTANSSGSLEVAIGKAGPTKSQYLRLGRGTSQHVLVAGRTGSGKSSLLHVLITNLALNYSPDELEFYLIDFKKGVEFKMYARYELPHARVIAIESEREFGVSVLQRLDQELNERGERFRAAGVQDLKGYREIEGLPPLPRVLLVVDEFQEFFVEEDSLANEAAMLLDRLVRQGRAFGVHALMGSQTLSGTYSLPRSTLGQMAVRIALQCTESDSSMILSEENSAGRLLSRPGEAIYNDANGLVEGNHFFQVVWLPEALREDYLRRIRDLAKSRGWPRSRSQIIFEGDAPALIARNALLQAKLAPHYWPPAPAPALAWLGDSIQIKNPTSASFHRQSGNNLLIVGQDTALAGGILTSSLISLASHFAPEGPSSARFFILDGAPHDSAISGLFALLKKILPHSLRIGGRREVSSFLAELVDEIDRRIDGESKGDVELFLFVHNLAWFREIRKDEAYEFTASKDTSIPSIAIAKILRDGPPVGIYVLAWSDNLNNLNRTFDRSTQREFGVRVAFQMSASDSSHYLDTPQASRLGKHMAYCLDEEQGTLEKFRPYGIPSEDCLTWVQEQFARRPKVAPEEDFA